MMKKNHRHMLTALSILLSVNIFSCEKQSDSTDEQVTFDMQGSIRMYQSIDECMENADFIVSCTVSEVGESYLNGDPSLPDGDGDELSEYIRSIRTPVTLDINEIYYDSTGELVDTLTVTENRGTYNGYTLTNQFPEYKEGHNYILFIAQASDGKTNIVIHQGSAELSDRDSSDFSAGSSDESEFEPMFNSAVFDGINSLNDLVDAINASAETKK